MKKRRITSRVHIGARDDEGRDQRAVERLSVLGLRA